MHPNVSTTGPAVPPSLQHKVLSISGSQFPTHKMTTSASSLLPAQLSQKRVSLNPSRASLLLLHTGADEPPPGTRSSQAHGEASPEIPPIPTMTGLPTYLRVVTVPGTQLWAGRILKDGPRWRGAKRHVTRLWSVSCWSTRRGGPAWLLVVAGGLCWDSV